jgi:hypothetical protein
MHDAEVIIRGIHAIAHAAESLLRQATDLVAMSCDAIARSREKVARLEFTAVVVPPARPFTER